MKVAVEGLGNYIPTAITVKYQMRRKKDFKCNTKHSDVNGLYILNDTDNLRYE
jgi:hypothetical protein